MKKLNLHLKHKILSICIYGMFVNDSLKDAQQEVWDFLNCNHPGLDEKLVKHFLKKIEPHVLTSYERMRNIVELESKLLIQIHKL